MKLPEKRRDLPASFASLCVTQPSLPWLSYATAKSQING